MQAEKISMRIQFIKIWLGFVTTLLFQSCLGGPDLFKQEGSADGAFLNLKLLQTEEGVFNIQVDSNSVTNQSALLPDGTQVQFPPGSLVLSSEVTIEYGSSLTSAELASSTGAGSFSSASSTVVISSSTAQDANNPFSLELPISSTSLRFALNDPYEKLIVIYKRSKVSSSELAEGIIPRSDISISDGKARFSTRYFGAFQLAYSQNLIQQSTERSATAPILTKRGENKLSPITWSVSAPQWDASANAKVAFEAKGMTSPLKCMAYVDRDKKSSFDIAKATSSDKEVQFASSEFSAFTNSDIFYISIHCSDAVGRVAASDWSSFPRSSSSGAAATFSLTSYTASTAASPQPLAQSIQLGFSEMPTSASVPNGIKLQNNRSYWMPPFSIGVNEASKQLSFNPVLGAWPIYSSFNLQLFSPTLKSSSGASLDKNYTVGVHTADGAWQSDAVIDNAANNSTKFLMDINDSGKMVYIRGSSTNAYLNYFDGTSWVGEHMISTVFIYSLGAYVDANGVGFVSFSDSTLSDYYLYKFDPASPGWVSIHHEVSGSLQVFRSPMIVSHKASGSAYYLYSQTNSPNKLFACKLNSSTTNCTGAIDFGFAGLTTGIFYAKVNAQGDLLVSYNVSSVTKARILLADGTLLPLFTSLNNSTDTNSFSGGIFDRKAGESFPRALMVYTRTSSSTFYPVYIRFDGNSWGSETNLLGSGNTIGSTQAPGVEVSANGNAIIVVREPSSTLLHIRMFAGYGDESVFQTVPAITSDTYWRSNVAINQDGVALIAFKKATTEIAHVLCTKGASSITCNADTEANSSFPAQDVQLFNLGVDEAGNFISVFQSTLNASYLMRAKRIRYDANNAIPSSSDIDLGVSVAGCEISLVVTPSGKAVAGCQAAAKISIARFK